MLISNVCATCYCYLAVCHQQIFHPILRCSQISYFILRLILPNRTFPPTWRQLTLYLTTTIPELVLFQHLTSTGSPKREPTTGALLAPGEDLSQGGVTEWCFDVIYITWFCQVGSALVGEFVWWLYLSVCFHTRPRLKQSLVAHG